MTKDEALKLALEALEDSVDTIRREYETDWRHGLPTRKAQLDGMKQALDNHEAAITAIREALAQPEPCRHRIADIRNEAVKSGYMCMDCGALFGAYTAPPHRKPLTDVTIWNTYKNLWMFHPAEEPRLAGDILKFARAIEAAHGIKE